MTKPAGCPKRPFHLSPPQTISLGFAAMIAAGTLLLSLSIASRNGQSAGLMGALFTATSANCVTGLVVADTFSQWTVFGQLRGLVLAALFQSVTPRTAGCYTILQCGLSEASVLGSYALMFIVGFPAGTAGGIKTVTLGVVLFSIWSVLRGRSRVEAIGRTLALDLLQKNDVLVVLCGASGGRG